MTRRLKGLKEITDAVDAGETVCWREDSLRVGWRHEQLVVVHEDGSVIKTSPVPVLASVSPEDFYIIEDAPADDAGEAMPGELVVVVRRVAHQGVYRLIVEKGEEEYPFKNPVADIHGEHGEDFANHIVALHNYFSGIADPVAAVEELKAAAETLAHRLPCGGVAGSGDARAIARYEQALAALTPKENGGRLGITNRYNDHRDPRAAVTDTN